MGQKKEVLEARLKEELEAARMVVTKKVELLEFQLEQEHEEQMR